jgi:hypothetical protein
MPDMSTIQTRSVAVAAYALAHGGQLQGYERGEFVVTSPWPVPEILVRFAKSEERRFDDHVMRLRELKRSSIS